MLPSPLEMTVEMQRWDQLVAYLEEHHADTRVFPGDRLRVTVRDRAFGGYLLRTPSETPWIVLALKLRPQDELRPRPALLANAELPFGSIALLAGHAVLRQSLPLEGLRSEVLEHTFDALAWLAGELAGADSPHAYIYR